MALWCASASHILDDIVHFHICLILHSCTVKLPPEALWSLLVKILRQCNRFIHLFRAHMRESVDRLRFMAKMNLSSLWLAHAKQIFLCILEAHGMRTPRLFKNNMVGQREGAECARARTAIRRIQATDIDIPHSVRRG
jgi:hypothetical protein